MLQSKEPGLADFFGDVSNERLPGILGECCSFWDEEEEDGPPIFRVEEQEWFEIVWEPAHNVF